jgi:hypothetical protein
MLGARLTPFRLLSVRTEGKNALSFVMPQVVYVLYSESVFNK